MEREFSFKELYDVRLKLTYPIEIKNKNFEEGETVAFFDKIELANLEEIKSMVTANGGFDNRAHIFWESSKGVNLIFTQGVFSKTQYALLNNSALVQNHVNKFLITKREILTPEEGIISLKHSPEGKIFIYKQSNGEKIDNFTLIEGTKYQTNEFVDNVIVDYEYYAKGKDSIIIGQQFLRGYLSLEGKTRIKDDITGQVKTGIIKIPKLKLMSNLSMKLGDGASPIMGVCQAMGYPDGERGNSRVMEILFLDEYIDDDM